MDFKHFGLTNQITEEGVIAIATAEAVVRRVITGYYA